MECAATGWPLMVVISTPSWLLGAHPFLPARAKEMRQARGRLRPLRLFGRQKDQQIGIAAPEPRNQLAVAQNHFRIGGARQHARRRSPNPLRPPANPASARPSHTDWPDRPRPAAQTPASPPAARVRNWRSRSTAAGSANCVAPRPATK